MNNALYTRQSVDEKKRVLQLQALIDQRQREYSPVEKKFKVKKESVLKKEKKQQGEIQVIKLKEKKKFGILKKFSVIEKKKQKKKEKKKEKKSKFAIKKFNKWFKYSLGYKTTFANFSNASTNREYLKAFLSISPMKYFFIGATFKKDINTYYNKYYQPDFSYTFGYNDWHLGTVHFTYANYANNKFNPKGKERRFNFKLGTWNLGYKDRFWDVRFATGLKYIAKSKKGLFTFRVYKVFPHDLLLSGKLKTYLYMNQQQLTLTVKKYFYRNFFIKGSLYLYTHPDKETFLESDYAYAFGWKSEKGDISIYYSNYYMPTRWNWREKEGPAFNTGSLFITIRF